MKMTECDYCGKPMQVPDDYEESSGKFCNQECYEAEQRSNEIP